METAWHLHLDCTDSTNTEVRRQLAARELPDGFVVTASCQTAGKGRLGRAWHSRAGANLLWSCWTELALPPAEVAGFSLIPGLAVLDMLDGLGVRAGCKWPNDVRVNGRKLAGILTECFAGEGGSIRGAIVGIGINVLGAPGTEECPGSVTPPVALSGLLPVPPAPGSLAEPLREALLSRVRQWRAGDRQPLLEAWYARCDHRDAMVRVTLDGIKQEGKTCGLGPQGQLLLSVAGSVREVWADDVEMR